MCHPSFHIANTSEGAISIAEKIELLLASNNEAVPNILHKRTVHFLWHQPSHTLNLYSKNVTEHLIYYKRNLISPEPKHHSPKAESMAVPASTKLKNGNHILSTFVGGIALMSQVKDQLIICNLTA